MADAKISALTALTGATVATGDQLAIVDVSATTTKSLTAAELLDYLRRNGMPRISQLTGTHSNATATGTEVTDLQQTLEAGTYAFEYTLIVRTTATGTGVQLGVNFTGTAAVKTMVAYWADATAAITAESHIMDDQGVLTFGYISGMANRAYTTTAPNMGTTLGETATGVDIPMFIKGVVIVTGAGDLELWHSSETANATTVEIGSSLVVVRTA